MSASMEPSVESEEEIDSFEIIESQELMTTTIPLRPECAEGESEENPFNHFCLLCYRWYKDYERHLWAVSMKMEDESMCNECHQEKWKKFKEVLKDTAEKAGFVIVKDETDHFERGQEVLPPQTVGRTSPKDIPEKMKKVEGKNDSTKADIKLEEENASTKVEENLEEKVSTEADDDGIDVVYETGASVGSEEEMMNFFKNFDFEKAMRASLPDYAEGESEKKPFYHCFTCSCEYKDYERDLWTVSMKLEDESMCNECQHEKWKQFKKILKDTAEKHGFVIAKAETEQFERGQEVLPPITVGRTLPQDIPEKMIKLEEENASTKAEEQFERGQEVLPPITIKLEENASTKAEENLEEKVSTEADDDGTDVIYETDKRCTFHEGNGAAKKIE